MILRVIRGKLLDAYEVSIMRLCWRDCRCQLSTAIMSPGVLHLGGVNLIISFEQCGLAQDETSFELHAVSRLRLIYGRNCLASARILLPSGHYLWWM